ncbi:MAG: lamin tail domain-containing protein, partial [Candidatus Aegiribacteria sp.]|nr:lamin tail domain-containing protein [Candidatus Aegiribacteria sp.]
MVFYAILQFALFSQPPVITEIAPNPLLEISGEFVEIYNPSSEPMCLEGYSITDGDALDELLPWDEGIHGPFPHSGMLLGTDTIPPFGFALVFELDYPDAPAYDIPSGTLILTTGDHSICNGLAASSDPLTLFDPGGTANSNAVSTYGTPLPSDIWQNRDDDELDGIPFDPGEDRTVERFPWSSSDQEGSWSAGPEGGSPGSHAEAPSDTLNISCDSVWTLPSEPSPGELFQIRASFTCWGNTVPSSGTLVLFLDSQGDSTVSPDEILAEFSATVLQPGYTEIFTVFLSLEQGWFLPSAVADVPEDEYPEDDFASSVLAVGGGINPVITEVLCNPLDEDTGEFIEIYYPGPGIFPICGCSFTDGDALDCICKWSEALLIDPSAVYGSCIPSEHYGLIMDPEYAGGMQEYDLAESTFVFTVENTTIGDGLTGNDPVTLYNMLGTAQVNVLSTYGTPLQYDDPLLCDDDELDGIPFDPGEFHSVERKSSDLPDEEYFWAVSPEGGTPG